MKTVAFGALNVLVLSGFVSLAGNRARADEADATAETQALLTDPAQRERAMQNDAKAQQADLNLRALMGNDPAKTEAAYGISSGIFADMVAKAKGDPDKLQQMLQQAAINPETFGQSLTPDQRAHIRDLAGQMDSSVSNTP